MEYAAKCRKVQLQSAAKCSTLQHFQVFWNILRCCKVPQSAAKCKSGCRSTRGRRQSLLQLARGAGTETHTPPFLPLFRGLPGFFWIFWDFSRDKQLCRSTRVGGNRFCTVPGGHISPLWGGRGADFCVTSNLVAATGWPCGCDHRVLRP